MAGSGKKSSAKSATKKSARKTTSKVASKKSTNQEAAVKKAKTAVKKSAAKKTSTQKTAKKKSAVTKKSATKKAPVKQVAKSKVVPKKTAEKATPKKKVTTDNPAGKPPIEKNHSVTASKTTTNPDNSDKKEITEITNVVDLHAVKKEKKLTPPSTTTRAKIEKTMEQSPPAAPPKKEYKYKSEPISASGISSILDEVLPPEPSSLPIQPSISTTIGIMGISPYDIKEGEEYMCTAQKAHFRNILSMWKQSLMEEVDRIVNQMQDEAANFPDPNDRATQEEEFGLALRARDRERKLIKKIDEALDRILEDEYGFCENCGIEIGIRRLEARPTATLCIDCKTLDEIRERQNR